MLAQAGLPARVVMGFAPEQTSPGAEIAVTGADVKAWVEVPLQGYGWVAFHPTPEQEPQEQTPQARDKPRVQVPQPPIPPQEPAELPPQPPEAEEGEEAPGPDYLWLWQVLTISSIVLAVLALILGPGLVMLWLKARRRAKRRAAEQLPDRVSGAWSEIVDAAADLGTPVTAAATRRENAAELDGHYPALALPSLAAKADGAVFGFGEPAAAEVDAYWADVETVRQRLEAQAKLKQRLRRFFAPASILGRWRWGR
ncbi:MAG: transglutaminase domain-containing protein [Micropruina sp.]|nr:transglutaminase domain-containing protein [Micropruina sp.]